MVQFSVNTWIITICKVNKTSETDRIYSCITTRYIDLNVSQPVELCYSKNLFVSFAMAECLQ